MKHQGEDGDDDGDVDDARDVGVAVLALVLHELRPYKRNAGLTFDKAHAAREWAERRDAMAAEKRATRAKKTS